MTAPHPMRYSLAELQTMLLHQLANYDEIASRRTIAQALAVHSVEDVCTDLLSPVLDQIGELWADGELNVVAEHFASNVVRAHLESIFRSLGEFETGPLVVVGCAPGEQHEIGALMLAVFLRRVGMRTAYLGQNVETASLLQTIRALRPAAVVLTAVMPESARTVAQVADLVADLSVPGFVLGFGGPAFAGKPESAETIPGLFLDADLAQATSTIRARLAG
jgi:methanogenic corrinoid protein MtbC1